MSSAVNVMFFASLREEVGLDSLPIEAATLDELRSKLANTLSPDSAAALAQENIRIAVNQTIVEGNVALSGGDEVAFLPPVTGG